MAGSKNLERKMNEEINIIILFIIFLAFLFFEYRRITIDRERRKLKIIEESLKGEKNADDIKDRK